MKITHSIVGLLGILIAIQASSALAGAPAGISIQVISTFDYPGTGNLTRPQKISNKGDIIGIYLDSSGVSRGFLRFGGTRNFVPLVAPDDTGNDTEGRGINKGAGPVRRQCLIVHRMLGSDGKAGDGKGGNGCRRGRVSSS